MKRRGILFVVSGPSGTFNVTTNTLEGNKDGYKAYVTLDNLLPGDYTVTETNIPMKYYTESSTQTITVLPNQTASATF
ncbi:MAG: SpaA isopeptide-forming pilin-related protein, partial [Christensenellales bacterium]